MTGERHVPHLLDSRFPRQPRRLHSTASRELRRLPPCRCCAPAHCGVRVFGPTLHFLFLGFPFRPATRASFWHHRATGRYSLSPSSAAHSRVPLKYWRQWRRWSPPPPASAACERSSRRRRARLASSATSSRSSRRRRRRRRRSLRRGEIAPVVCESLGLDMPVRSGRGCRSPVWSPRSGVVCACWAPLGFHIPRKKITGASSLLRVSRSVCGCIRALDVPGAGCPRGGSTPRRALWNRRCCSRATCNRRCLICVRLCCYTRAAAACSALRAVFGGLGSGVF